MKKIWNRMAGLVFGVALILGIPAMDAAAAEYTVTEAAAVLYTNDQTVILADADDSTVVLPEVAADLPIQVTGVTSNGYFQICLDGQTFYIQGIGLSAADTADTVGTEESRVYHHGTESCLSGGIALDKRQLLWLEGRNLHRRFWMRRVCVCGERCGVWRCEGNDSQGLFQYQSR